MYQWRLTLSGQRIIRPGLELRFGQTELFSAALLIFFFSLFDAEECKMCQTGRKRNREANGELINTLPPPLLLVASVYSVVSVEK